MRKRKTLRTKMSGQTKITLIGLGVIEFAMLALVFRYQVFASTKNQAPVPSLAIESPALENVGVPQRLQIPSIALDALIEPVTVTKRGSLGVPRDPLNAGWYDLGVRPGEEGNAVIDGHVNWYYGATGVFQNLRNVHEGDSILVEDDLGSFTTFIVREVRTYDAAADASDIFNSTDHKAHLNLITCEGAWNKATKQYSERLVVFADLSL